MKILSLASLALIGLASQAHAYSIDSNVANGALPKTYAPTAITSTAPYNANQTNSITNEELSPFSGSTYDGRAYDAVLANGSATFAASAFGQSSGSAGIFTFVYGSPDTYNALTFNLVGGGVVSLTGSDIGATPQNGYSLVRISGIGDYSSVTFGSPGSNAFEFAAVSPVPLPASLPLFGTALLGLGAIGYGVKRKKSATAA